MTTEEILDLRKILGSISFTGCQVLESNPGQLGERRERCLCATPSPLLLICQNLFYFLTWLQQDCHISETELMSCRNDSVLLNKTFPIENKTEVK